MFKYVLSLTFAVGLASAATISTTVNCDGVTTVGTFSASCNDGRFMAQASIGISGGLSISVDAGPVAGPMTLPSGSASANFFDDYVFTVTGGTGEGFFFPCFNGGRDAGADVGIFIGGIGEDPETTV